MKKSTAKQIEATNKKIEKYTNGIERYKALKNKALAAINLTEDDFEVKIKGWSVSVRVKDANLNNTIGWSKISKVEINWQYQIENEKNLEYERKHLEELNKVAAEQDNEERKAQEERNANKPLEDLLNKELASFKSEWYAVTIEGYSNYFDRVLKAYNELAAEYKAIEKKRDTYADWNSYVTELNKVYAKIEKVRWAKKMNKDAYMEQTAKELETYWTDSIHILADKLVKYEIDINKISFTFPRMSGGINVLIKDGKNRVIDARLIWAAEYSQIVTPHTRYIVTERKTK